MNQSDDGEGSPSYRIRDRKMCMHATLVGSPFSCLGWVGRQATAAGAYSARRTLVPTDLTRGYGDWGESANTGPELSVKKVRHRPRRGWRVAACVDSMSSSCNESRDDDTVDEAVVSMDTIRRE